MKGLFYLLKRFIPPYKGCFRTVSLIFSGLFLALSLSLPSARYLEFFSAQQLVTEPVDFALNVESVKQFLYYKMSMIISNEGGVQGTVPRGFFMIIMVFLKVALPTCQFCMVPIRNGVVRTYAIKFTKINVFTIRLLFKRTKRGHYGPHCR